ncbi:DoxX family protein [Pseudonocardia sp. HH130630-07]|uniref:DoxX family protein n=1 Tax=Pseudonocardia sp. HH130630-07 TaxID=1690815 RepID=UPI000815090A|nr:DoxX family protein [Pseudonocardia sp. HH130630-07]ANY05496.1 DoxX family protein [Pseudonocardia sp. HH130630-07]
MSVHSGTRSSLSPAAHRALWVLQILLAVFMVLASAAPKLVGEATAVQIFAEIGVGQWLRYVIGVLELAGGVGMLTRRFSGPAAVGLALLMVGAALTQLFVLDGGLLALTPVVLGLLCAVVAAGRRETLTTAR